MVRIFLGLWITSVDNFALACRRRRNKRIGPRDLFPTRFQFRYQYPEGKAVRPFFNVGFSNSMIINNKSYRNDYNSADNSNTHGPIFGISGGIKSYQVGIIGGAGITAGPWNIEARIERLPRARGPHSLCP